VRAVKFVGLSGGIGAGKSTVAARLVHRGAVTIDVDVLSRQLQEPGMPLFDQIVARWGPTVLDPDGRLDRAALGQIVFGDPTQLAELTLMAAPITEHELIRLARQHLGTNQVVVAEAALYREPMYGMEGLIVVDVDPEVAVARLVGSRGMREEDARARIAAQLSREDRLRNAGYVIDNSGGLDALEPLVEAAWTWIEGLPDATPAAPS
jgi:dephospho-CoA kinase